jgi:hypothetical protein
MNWMQGLLPPPIARRSSTMVLRPLTSAAGVLALLSETDKTLRQHALVALNPLVPQFWAEISENLTEMYASFIKISYL